MSVERSLSHKHKSKRSNSKKQTTKETESDHTSTAEAVTSQTVASQPAASQPAASQPTAVQVDDNITDEQAPPVEYPTTEVYNCTQACHAVGVKTGIKRISMLPSPQMTDGSLVEFMDTEKKEIVATGRLRLTNKLHIDKASGNMALFTVIGDLVFERSSITVELEKEVARL